MRVTTTKLSLAAAVAALLVGAAVPSFAQSEGSAPAVAESAASKPLTNAEKKQQAKAQRKAERKAARARNNAELKQLGENGYRPSQNDPNYPQNLQNAQKKANAAAGASQ
ncbi:DUF4148 domain-containing protein [Paraburkholderia sp. EG286B]|uniref:DUF4148 domain-containing protein n=1 Tax=Paraburkholderia sp. EG286B TaxID=3237011 RepID=UPI0034D2A908